jgi:hypothetical protein
VRRQWDDAVPSGDSPPVSRPAGLAVLPPGYGPLFDKATALFAADDRVRAMWVHGALARGEADAGSDLDISLAVRDADFSAFAAQWEQWLAAITPTFTARKISDGSFYALTTTCERFDVISEPVSRLADTKQGGHLLFHRGDPSPGGELPRRHDPR